MSFESKKIEPGKPTMIDGSYYIHEFGRWEDGTIKIYKEIIKINFENSPSIKEIFEKIVKTIQQEKKRSY
jgi:hypothetical protein